AVDARVQGAGHVDQRGRRLLEPGAGASQVGGGQHRTGHESRDAGEPAESEQLMAGAATARGDPDRRAHSSTHLTRSPRKTGPSVQARTVRGTPSSPTTGTPQPWQRPVPQGWPDSRATWLQAPCCSAAAATAWRVAGAGATAYTTAAPVLASTSGSTSVTAPARPIEPSAVATVTVRTARRRSWAGSTSAAST